MAPAFSSTKQAAVFALLLLVLLLLPALMGPSLLPSREQVYSSTWWDSGAFPYIEQQIFIEKGDIDIAIIGPSHIWEGIDAPYIQKALSEKLGRPAVVRTLGWGGGGYDALYFIARDLLEHRKVRLIVFYDSQDGANAPHISAPQFFRYGEDADTLDGLTWNVKASYYFAAILGLPRNLLGQIRTDLPADLSPSKKGYWEIKKQTDSLPLRLGSMATRLGFTSSLNSEHTTFEDFSPDYHPKLNDVVIYSEATRDKFKFTGSDVPAMQLHFARKFGSVAREHQTALAMVHIPTYTDRKDTVITERIFWPDVMQDNLAMIGIPSAELFEGLTDDDVRKLFADANHMNKNGEAYFTSLITPDLLKVYENGTSR